MGTLIFTESEDKALAEALRWCSLTISEQYDTFRYASSAYFRKLRSLYLSQAEEEEGPLASNLPITLGLGLAFFNMPRSIFEREEATLFLPLAPTPERLIWDFREVYFFHDFTRINSIDFDSLLALNQGVCRLNLREFTDIDTCRFVLNWAYLCSTFSPVLGRRFFASSIKSMYAALIKLGYFILDPTGRRVFLYMRRKVGIPEGFEILETHERGYLCCCDYVLRSEQRGYDMYRDFPFLARNLYDASQHDHYIQAKGLPWYFAWLSGSEELIASAKNAALALGETGGRDEE